MMAGYRGELVLDDEGCLRIEGQGSVVPIWPSDYELDTGSDRIAARVGEEVYMSGARSGGRSKGGVIPNPVDHSLFPNYQD
jgi:hypothetical protein